MINISTDQYISKRDFNQKNLDSSSFIMIKKHNETFIKNKLNEYHNYFDHLYDKIDSNIILDEEQRTTIINDEDYIMIIAGAGSGKTTTISGKVKYLVDKLHINPSEILILSYTNKAVDELKNLIVNQFQLPVSILTFHKLAYSYLKDEHYKIITDASSIIDFYLTKMITEDKKEALKLLTFYQHYFDLSPIMLKLLQSKHYQHIINIYQKNKTLRGDYLYHSNEVMIADILYLNNITYYYHKEWWTTYFTFDINKQKYYLRVLQNNIIKCQHPIIFSNHHHIINITIPPINEDNIEEFMLELQHYKIINNVITLSDYYLNFLKLDHHKYEHFTQFCYNGIKSIKTNHTDINSLSINDMRTKIFLSFINKLYQYYQDYLLQNRCLDFDDLIREAEKKISYYDKKYKYVIVDEYQDISMSRFQFIKKLVKYNQAKLVVVGDDWQTIFSFAGSKINLFLEFQQQMGYAEELKITNTYRNSQELIDIAGMFVMQNNKQIKKQLHSSKYLSNPLTIVLYQNNIINCLCQIIDDLIIKYGLNKNILLLGRYHMDINNILDHQHFQITSNNKIIYLKNKNINIQFMTIHMAKGIGCDNVILINASKGIYGFPSLIETDQVMEAISGNCHNQHLEEERRLFYVALTRTKNEIYILTPSKNMSPFVEEIKKYPNIRVKKVTNMGKSEKKRKKY